MGLKEGPLILIEIELSSDYKSERETSTGSTLPLYILLPPTSPILSLILIKSLPFYHNISQCGLINLEQIVR